MAGGGEIDFITPDAGLPRRLLIDTRRRRSQVKQLEYKGTLRTAVDAAAAAYIVRRNASLLIGRTCQRQQRFLPGDRMPDFYRVTHGVNIFGRGLHAFVDCNAALSAQRQPCFPGQPCIRCHADGQYHHVSPQGRFSL